MRARPALRQITAASALAALCLGSSAWAGSAKSLYRCESPAGRVTFTDAPCARGSQASAWSAKVPSEGIAATGTRGSRAETGRLPATPRQSQVIGSTEPWADCRSRGGSFNVESRVCRLPPDTIEHMFSAR